MNANNFRFNLRDKLIISFGLISFLVSGATTFGLYTNMKRQNIEGFQRRALNSVAIAAFQQSGDEFEKLSSANDPFYETLRLRDLKIRNSDPEFVFVYTMRKDPQGIYFVVDGNDPSAEGFSAYGERYLEPSPYLVKNFDTMTQPIVEPEIYTDEYGSFLSGYAPILTSDGRKVGVLGLDISADAVLAKQREIRLLSLAVTAIATLLGVLAGSALGTLLIKPIQDLRSATQQIASGNLLVRSNITSRDEIEDLGHSLNTMADEIQTLVTGLEDRISERTRELTIANKQTRRRANQFEAVSQISRAIANIQDLETLLAKIAQVISEQFGHYHTGIFLLDEANEYAVLRAANSEGGRKMLERNHKLLVGQTGIVGYATATGQPRIALDVGTDAVFFNNPDLPNTHSEIALPLRVAGKVIGALDVQSEDQNAFSQDDISALSTLADQVSIAIQHARALEEAGRSLASMQVTYGESVLDSWKVMRRQSVGAGFRLSGASVKPLEQPMNDDHIQKALEQGKTIISADQASTLTIPIHMRGMTIGVINLKNKNPKKWSEDEVDIAEAVAERLSLAIETASLLRTAQQRADIERVTADITGKIGSSPQFEIILQTAAQELSKALGGSDVLVQIEPVALKLETTE